MAKPFTSELIFLPVIQERLPDLEQFSTQNGKFRFCSCMRWRMTSSEFQSSSKEARVAELERRICQGDPVGLLAYAEGEPIAWCSIAPRNLYARLERYRALPRIDDAEVWSLVCFFVDRRFRRQGMILHLIRAAIDYARSQGAQIIEAYPVEPESPSYTYMGSPTTFQRAGFRDVTPAGQTRQVMRYEIGLNT
jgi:GNAT superfamily N-acetyltransferase